MQIESFGGTDTGKKRKNNEDAYLMREQRGLFAVADGVGGNAGGETASRIAIETVDGAVPDLLGENDRTPPSGQGRNSDREAYALHQAFLLAHARIREEQKANPALSDMGTTLTVLLLSGKRAFLGHIGDSRAYLLRSGRLKQLSNDHSWVAEQVRAGALKQAQARTSPHRHMITRALGIGARIEPEITALDVQNSDTILLCSDGLTEMVDDATIKTLLAGSSPKGTVKQLIKAANDRGGADNITVLVVRVSGGRD